MVEGISRKDLEAMAEEQLEEYVYQVTKALAADFNNPEARRLFFVLNDLALKRWLENR